MTDKTVFEQIYELKLQKIDISNEIKRLMKTKEFTRVVYKNVNDQYKEYRKEYYNSEYKKKKETKHCDICHCDIKYFSWNSHIHTKKHLENANQ